jgi:exonuclease VII small subunit
LTRKGRQAHNSPLLPLLAEIEPQGVNRMWNKQDDSARTQPDLVARDLASNDVVSDDTPDLASLGDALIRPLMDDQLKKGSFPAPSRTVSGETHALPAQAPLLSSPTMKTYTEATSEFAQHASALMEHLPRLAKARAAYEEALRASAEMRKVLDAGDEKIRILMSQLEQKLSAHNLKPFADQKIPGPAKIERMKPPAELRPSAEAGGRTLRWP